MVAAAEQNGIERTFDKVGLKALSGQQNEGNHLLPPENYSYTTTIQCLL